MKVVECGLPRPLVTSSSPGCGEKRRLKSDDCSENVLRPGLFPTFFGHFMNSITIEDVLFPGLDMHFVMLCAILIHPV